MVKEIAVACLLLINLIYSYGQPTQQDIPYGSDPLQKLDYYSAATAGSPVLIVVHGGGWSQGSKGGYNFQNICQLFNNIGYAVVNINYRLSSQSTYPGYPAQPSDLACAIAWTKLNAQSFNGDSSKVILFGHSAGGHLVTLHGLNNDTSLLSGCNYNASLNVAAVMATNGVYNFDLTNPGRWSAINAMLTDSTTYWNQAQPASHVSVPGNTKFLFITGQNDGFLGTQQSVSFADSMKAHNYCIKFFLLPGFDHNAPIDSLTVADTTYKIMKNFSDSLWQNMLCNTPTGISGDPSFQINDIHIFPNPFRDEATIRVTSNDSEDHVSIKLHDMLNNEVLSIPDYALRKGENTIQLSGRTFPAGIYFLITRIGKERHVTKVCVQ